MFAYLHTMILSIEDYFEHFLDLRAENTEVFIFLFFALLFFSATVIFMLAIYLKRNIRLARSQKIKDYQFKYQLLIYEAIIESQEIKTSEHVAVVADKFRNHGLKSKLSKQALIELMISLKKSFSGQFERQLNQLYRELGLHEISLRKVKKGKWSEKAQGIRELAAMNYQEAWLEIAKLHCSCNQVLAQEAQMASIKLAEGKPLYFLDNYSKPLSLWQQINFYQYLLKVDRSLLPSFQRWLTSTNESVVVFSLKMIGIFNQAEAAPAVAGLLKHSSFQVKLNAIQTLTKLEAGDYINRLFNMIDIQDDNIKVATIKAFEKLGSEYHKKLLKPFLLDNSYQVRLAAAKALKGTRIKQDKLLDAQAQVRQEEILNHATDPNL